MTVFPYVLGNNAAGFPHAFVGTSTPRNIGIGRLHGRVIYGKIDQSAYSPVDTGLRVRFASGLVGVLEPRGFPGLELGAARFFHIAWPAGGPTSEYYTHLFEAVLKSRLSRVFSPAGADKQSADNQLASVFARWVLPHSGAEIYAEYGREDHNWNGRDLIVEPDHSASLGYGIRKAWLSGGTLRTIGLESINFEESTLARHRPQGGAYYHTFTRQGHTQLGQMLATSLVGSGAGTNVSYARYAPAGMTRLSWTRLVQSDPGRSGGSPNAKHAIEYERSVVRGRTTVASSFGIVYDMARPPGPADLVNVVIRARVTRAVASVKR